MRFVSSFQIYETREANHLGAQGTIKGTLQLLSKAIGKFALLWYLSECRLQSEGDHQRCSLDLPMKPEQFGTCDWRSRRKVISTV